MIPQHILDNPNSDIIVSYCVMKGNSTNPMGHAYLRFSYYCPDAKKMVINDGTGFYPTPVAKERTWRRKFTAMSFFEQGHVIQEKYRYLLSKGTSQPLNHYHKSWKISSEQYLTLVKKINTDRGEQAPLEDRNFAQEQQDLLKVKNELKKLSSAEKEAFLEKTNAEESEKDMQVQGPYFNIVQHSCKTDALKRLAEIGIDTQGIHNRLIDLPIYSGKLSAHTIEYDQTVNQLVWKSPLELSPHKKYSAESREMQSTILAQRQYHLLMSNIKEVIALFDLKLNDVNCRSFETISKSRADLQNQLDIMLTAGLDPRHITTTQVGAYFEAYRGMINTTKTTLGQNNQGFIQKIMDKFIELCTQFASLVVKPNVVIYSEQYLLEKADTNVNHLDKKLRKGM
jgi:hypothetical protein